MDKDGFANNKMEENMNKSEKIESLQALRAVAFLGIFLLHSKVPWGWAKFGVSVFFVLSGFLMMVRYNDRDLPSGIGRFRFSVEKIKKLYPLHVLTMLSVVVIELLLGRHFGILKEQMIPLFRNIVLNVFLVQSWYPDSTVNVALNGVAWYLSVALFLYWTFPLLAVRLRGKRRRFQLCVIGMALASQFVLAFIMASRCGVDSTVYIWSMYCFPVFRLGDFVAGMALGQLYLQRGARKWESVTANSVVEIVALAVTIFGCIWLEQPSDSIFVNALKNWSSIYIIFAMIWIMLFINRAGVFTRALSCRPMIALGNISAQAFLIHYVIVRAANAFLGVKAIAFTPGVTYGAFAVEFIITILLSNIYKRISSRR